MNKLASILSAAGFVFIGVNTCLYTVQPGERVHHV